MSINFQDDANDRSLALIRDQFGAHVAGQDERTTLLDRIEKACGEQLSEIAREAGQPLTLEINSLGDQKVIDGVTWTLRSGGWKKS